MWIDHGRIRMHGGIEEVVRAYEGPEAGDHVARTLAELAAHEAAEAGAAAASAADSGRA